MGNPARRPAWWFALCFILATASGEPHRLGVHENPLGAMEDECPEYPPSARASYFGRGIDDPAWQPGTRDEPWRLSRARETTITRACDVNPDPHYACDGPDIPAVEREFRQGRAHFTIQVESGHWWDPHDKVHEVARALAVMPGVLTQRLPHTYVRVTGVGNWATAGYVVGPIPEGYRLQHRILDDGSIWWWRTVPLDVSFFVTFSAEPVGTGTDEPGIRPSTLLHELAHIMDYRSEYPGIGKLERVADFDKSAYSTSGEDRVDVVARVVGAFPWFSHTTAWQRAIGESPCAVSEYATTSPGEDFAESVIAWFLYYRLGAVVRNLHRSNQDYAEGLGLTLAEIKETRSVLRERLGLRFRALNVFMHDSFPAFPLVPPGGWPSD